MHYIGWNEGDLMPIEIRGQQLRIRVKDPRLFSVFRIHDVGRKGYLQRVAGKYKNKNKWEGF